MGIVKITGGVVKSVVDVKSWLGYDRLKGDSKDLLGIIKTGFSAQKTSYKETFEEALIRQNISENDLPNLVHRYKIQMFLYILFATIISIYMLYLFWGVHLFVGFITFMIVILFIVKACSIHFYIFQIRNRKLGCTLKEWLDGKINEE